MHNNSYQNFCSLQSFRVKDIPSSERPRERLARLGSSSLSDIELIAILLRTGTKGTSSLNLAHQLLAKYKTLNALARCNYKEIASIKGIGTTKALELIAAFNLAQRLACEVQTLQKIETPKDVCELLGLEMRGLRKESLRLLLLNSRRHLIRIEEISLGSMSESIAHPREIFRPAIIYSAHSVILVHNHPSGDPSPSDADCRLTLRLNEVASLLQVHFLDHIIIGAKCKDNDFDYFSFKENDR